MLCVGLLQGTESFKSSDSEINSMAVPPYEDYGSEDNYVDYGSYQAHLEAWYTFYNYPDYPQNNYLISVGDASSYLTGSHPLLEWTEIRATARLVNKTKIHAECKGTWDTYVYIPGYGDKLIRQTADSWSWDSTFIPQ